MNHELDHERALRRAMEAEAAEVTIRPDALGEIRRRIAQRRRWAPWRLALSGGTVLAVAGAAAALVLVAGPGGRPTVAPTVAPGATRDPTVPSVTATPTPSTTSPSPTDGSTSGTPGAAADARATLAIYHVGTDRLTTEAGEQVTRPRLYREFRRLGTGDGSPSARVRAAVNAALAQAAADPDHARVWPTAARVRDVGVRGSTALLDLAGAGAAATTTLDAERAKVAVQQLVWTATAASGLPGVRLLLDGRPADRLWGHVDGDAVQRRAPMVEVVAPVWLISPQHGESVGRRVQVHVAGFVFEATAQLRVRQGERVVAERVLTLSAGAPAQGEARLTLTLPPGRYVFEVYELSAVDGSVQHLDDHTVNVG